MKRFLLAVVLVVAATVLLLPGALGWVAERGHAQAVERARSAGHDLAAEHYRRGWFASEALHRYRIDDARLAYAADIYTGDHDSDALLIETRLHHGPVPALLTGGGALAPAWTESTSTMALRDVSGAVHALPGRLSSRLEADGRSQFRYEADPGQHRLDDTVSAAWQATWLDLSLSRNADVAQFEGAMDGLELRDADAALTLGRLHVAGDPQRDASGVWTGTSAWELERIATPRGAAHGVTLATHVSMVGDQPVYRLIGAADELALDELGGDDARLDIELRQVDAHALGDLIELLSTGRPQALFEPQQRALLHQLLAPGPRVELRDLRLPTGASAIEGKASLRIAAGTPPDGPFAPALEGRAEMAVPRELVEEIAAASTDQVRAAIELMIQFGMLRREGDRYRINAAYADGLLSINGFPVPLPAF